MKKRWKMSAAIVVVLVLGGVLAGPIMSDVERPDYEVISSAAQNIELRRYAPMIIAQVDCQWRRMPRQSAAIYCDGRSAARLHASDCLAGGAEGRLCFG